MIFTRPAEAAALERESRYAVRRAFIRGLTPDPRLTVSEWADANRKLGSRESAEPGPWRTSRTPYLREIMDCLSSTSPIEVLVFIKGSQIGGTEVGNNWIGYTVDHDPGPMMVVMPTEGTQRRQAKQRLEPMYRETPQLAEKISESETGRGGGSAMTKLFPGGILVLASAMSAADLRSMPVRKLFLDELDAFPDELEGEGDPDELAERGTRTFRNRKVFKVSTPTTEHESKIARQFRLTDRRYYHVPCPHCGFMQRIEWPRIQWDGHEDEKIPREELILDLTEARREAWLICGNEECEQRIDEFHKTEMLAGGQWIPEIPERGDRVRGYHLSALYSPFGMYPWRLSVAKFLKAKGRPQALRVWVNQDLGETWKDKGEAPDWERLYQQRETYPTGIVPRGGYVLTAGVDVQGDRLEVEVVAWGPDLESWSVDYRVIPGEVEGEEAWEDLDRLLLHEFDREDGHGGLRISSLCVDAGAYTQIVYGWARKFGRNRRVHCIRGRTGVGAFVGIPSLVDIQVAGRRIKKGIRSWPVDSGVGKEDLYALLRLKAPLEEEDGFPPGFCHFPQYGQEFFRNLCSEVLVRRRIKSGKIVVDWEVIPGRRNETLDVRVYARAAASILGIDRWTLQDWNQARGLGAPQETERKERKKGSRWRNRGHKRT